MLREPLHCPHHTTSGLPLLRLLRDVTNSLVQTPVKTAKYACHMHVW